jgi:hypothetical protein
LKETSPQAFDRLLYVEQPTDRNLAAQRLDMRRLAALKPVLADEGILDLATFGLARELGWFGIALETCKGHSSALLYVAKASQIGMPYSVQDLTNPDLAFVHSAALAARIYPLKGGGLQCPPVSSPGGDPGAAGSQYAVSGSRWVYPHRDNR